MPAATRGIHFPAPVATGTTMSVDPSAIVDDVTGAAVASGRVSGDVMLATFYAKGNTSLLPSVAGMVADIQSVTGQAWTAISQQDVGGNARRWLIGKVADGTESAITFKMAGPMTDGQVAATSAAGWHAAKLWVISGANAAVVDGGGPGVRRRNNNVAQAANSVAAPGPNAAGATGAAAQVGDLLIQFGTAYISTTTNQQAAGSSVWSYGTKKEDTANGGGVFTALLAAVIAGGEGDNTITFTPAATTTELVALGQTLVIAAAGGGGGGDTTAPTCAITSPAAGASVSGTVSLAATASDNVGVVDVQFKLDGVNLGVADATSPYGISWDTTTAINGTHSITAVARDAAGNTVTATAITVTVSNGTPPDTTPPTCTITAPAAGSTVSGVVSLTATASDNVGVSSVQFKVDGVNVGSPDTSSPFSASWDTTLATNATHAITAVASDAAGNTVTAAVVNVTVNNATPPPASTDKLPVVILGSSGRRTVGFQLYNATTKAPIGSRVLSAVTEVGKTGLYDITTPISRPASGSYIVVIDDGTPAAGHLAALSYNV